MFSALFRSLAKALQWLALSLILSVIIEWVGMVMWWPEQGAAHSRGMLRTEIGYLDQDFRHSIMTSSPAHFARCFADTSYTYLFEWSGFVDFFNWAQADPAVDHRPMQRFFHRFIAPVAEFILAAITITQVFSVRVAILTLALPVFVLFALLGVVDGLVMRDLRRWGGGRESSFVYHHAKKTIVPTFVIAWVLYLALPFSLHPSVVILPFAALLALALAVTSRTFKKYL
ncbi:MAG: TIGR03747 family integrating conjugative element membrane protein [bacterium]|nr:TIGR03747 family integrating conjugative element membrane protein [bacterium]